MYPQELLLSTLKVSPFILCLVCLLGGDHKQLQGQKLINTPESFADVSFSSLMKCQWLGEKLAQVERRLRQIFPHQSQEILGGCLCILFGDFSQLPPMLDLPLYTTLRVLAGF